MFRTNLILVLAVTLSLLAACSRDSNVQPSANSAEGATDRPLTIGVCFETLQTQYWVAGFEAIKSDIERRGFTMLEAVANQDANRQLEQVKNFINRKVDGIILVPKDGKTCLPMIKAANIAGIPIVLFNRPADKSDAKSVAVVADNFALARNTVAYMVAEAKKAGGRRKAALLVGDLGDMNAINRREGFESAVNAEPGLIEVVAQIPTEWSQEKAQAGLVNALQANPDISFIFTSSDFLLPGIVSALKSAGKYHRIGTPGHVLLGGFDGDGTAYQMLKDGYLDATGVQDVHFEASQCVKAIMDLCSGVQVSEQILDNGFVIHQGNLDKAADRMWGAQKR